MHDDLGVAGITAGWVLAIFAALGATGGIVFGQLADRLGRRRVAIAGLLCIAAASIGGAGAGNVATLLCARLLEGFGFIALAVAIPPLIAATAAGAADRRVALSLWASYLPLGTALALLAAPPVMAAGGWRLLWLVTGAAAAAAAGAIAVRIRPVPRATVRATARADVVAVLRARGPLPAAIAFGAYVASFFILIGFLPSILVATGIGIGPAALCTAGVVVANGCGNVAGGFATRFLARRVVLVSGALVLGAGGALLYLPGLPLGLRVGAAVVAALLGGMIPGAITAAVPELAPEPRLIATTQGLVVQWSSLGQLAGPLAVAAFGASRGGAAGSAVLLGLAALGATAALRLGRRAIH